MMLALDFDFYLQAHAGPQRTVKPMHYIMTNDMNQLAANAVPLLACWETWDIAFHNAPSG